jgi:hypothetical protein
MIEAGLFFFILGSVSVVFFGMCTVDCIQRPYNKNMTRLLTYGLNIGGLYFLIGCVLLIISTFR